MLPVARDDQATGFSSKCLGWGEMIVYKDHFCQGAKMYNQSFRLGFCGRNGSD